MTSSHMPTVLPQRVLRAYLGLDVSVVVVLEEQGGRFGVVFSGSNVQGRQADLAFGIVLQEDGDNLVVTLLKGNGQRSEAILEEKETVVYPWHAVGLKWDGWGISHYIHHFMFDDKYWQDHHKSYTQTLIPS